MASTLEVTSRKAGGKLASGDALECPAVNNIKFNFPPSFCCPLLRGFRTLNETWGGFIGIIGFMRSIGSIIRSLTGRVSLKVRAAIRPYTNKQLDALARQNYGKYDGIIRRLLTTCDDLRQREAGRTKYVDVQGPTMWLGWPDVDPVRRTANDWLRLAIMALNEYELEMIASDRVPYEVNR